MKFISALACLAVLLTASAAQAQEHRAFPPDNCADSVPFMSFTGHDGDNTKCIDGQTIFNNAIPVCSTGQVVAFDGGKFYCKSETAVPTCTPNEFLSFDGASYQCKSTGVATCGNNQVLTFNGTSYFCVNKDATIPVCGTNQFLTYNGSYRCATVTEPTIPNCPAGYTVTGNGSTLYCQAMSIPFPSCTDGESLSYQGGTLKCVSASVPSGTWCGWAATGGGPYGVAPPAYTQYNTSCLGYMPPSCPPGYSARQFMITGGTTIPATLGYSGTACVKN